MSGEAQLLNALLVATWTAGILYIVACVFAGVSLFAKDANADQSDALVVDESYLPQTPREFIQPSETFIETFNSVIAKERKLILTGPSGSGKTTFAVEMCRRYREKNGKSPVKQTPVFIPLSQARRTNGLLSMFVEQVSQNLANHHPIDPRGQAKRMLKKGDLLLIIDDLDYLGKRGHRELEEFIGKWRKNSFVCIISEKPRYPFLEDFQKVTMPQWLENDAKEYILRRIQESGKRKELIDHLEELKTLKQPLTPWQVKFLVDAYLEGCIFKLIELGSMENEREYKILDGYLRIVLENSGLEPLEAIRAIKELGGLALRLLKQGKSSFIPEKAGVNKSLVRSLTPKIFQQQANAFTFVHGNYQVVLASRYLGEFWSEANADLKDSEARTLIWGAVYSCTLQFIPESQKEDLRATFQRLSGN